MTIVTIVHKSQMKASAHPIDLEQRVADFAARVIGVCEKLPRSDCEFEISNRFYR